MPIPQPQPGPLARGEFPGLLLGLVRRLASGRLEVTDGNGGERRVLWLETGQVRAVVSDLEQEKLGSWLVAQGLLESHVMALNLLRQPEGLRFGAMLVQDGLISDERLERELHDLAVSIVSRMLTCEGTYRFFAGDQLPPEAAELEMTSASLLMAAVRRVDDITTLDRLLPQGAFLWGTEDALLQYQPVSLTSHEAFLVSRVDGTTTITQLRRLVPLPQDEVTRSLAALLVAGLLEVHGEPAGRATVPEVVELPSEAHVEDDDGLQFTADQQREYESVVRLAADCRGRDLYRRLNLTHGATLDQIHERYRQFTRLFHPDRAQEPHLRSLRRELAEIHAAMQEAYEILIIPDKRAAYDKELREQTAGGGAQRGEGTRRAEGARRELVLANVQRAQELARQGDVGAAVKLMDEVVRLEPRADHLLSLARLELRNPMWARRALAHLRHAVTVDERCTEAWLEMASFWARREQPIKQKQCLERVLSYDPVNEVVTAALAPLRAKK